MMVVKGPSLSFRCDDVPLSEVACGSRLRHRQSEGTFYRKDIWYSIKSSFVSRASAPRRERGEARTGGGARDRFLDLPPRGISIHETATAPFSPFFGTPKTKEVKTWGWVRRNKNSKQQTAGTGCLGLRRGVVYLRGSPPTLVPKS